MALSCIDENESMMGVGGCFSIDFEGSRTFWPFQKLLRDECDPDRKSDGSNCAAGGNAQFDPSVLHEDVDRRRGCSGMGVNCAHGFEGSSISSSIRQNHTGGKFEIALSFVISDSKR